MLIYIDDKEHDFTDWFYNTADLQPEIFHKDTFFRRLLDDMLLVLFPSGDIQYLTLNRINSHKPDCFFLLLNVLLTAAFDVFLWPF